MTELRMDYLTEEWVSIAEARGQRPFSVAAAPAGAMPGSRRDCPFCPQNKHMTTEESLVLGNVRVLANLYPMLQADSPLGFGYHEVVIDTPEHDKKMKDFTIQEIHNTLLAIRNRLEIFSANERIRYIQVFKNEGYHAGASLSHSHWQLVAMPFVPRKQQIMYWNFLRFREESGSCYLCREAAESNAFFVYRHQNVTAYCPPASPYAGTVCLTTTDHCSDFMRIEDETLLHFAVVLRKSLQCVDHLLPGAAYNICFYSGSFYHDYKYDPENWHFSLQIVPRTGMQAGYELSTGCAINALPPEKAAEQMRSYTDLGGRKLF